MRAKLSTGEEGYLCRVDQAFVLDKYATSEMVKKQLCGRCYRTSRQKIPLKWIAAWGAIWAAVAGLLVGILRL